MIDTDMKTHDQALTTRQVELEKLYSKNQLLKRLREEFISEPSVDFLKTFEELGIPGQFGLDLLVQMALHKQADLPTIVGLLYHHFSDAQLTADMILKAVDADLVDWSPRLKMLTTVFGVAPHVQLDLDRYQYPLPMVTQPQAVRNNRTSGYLIHNSSVILKDNHHDEDVCLDHLNVVNQVPLSINTECAQMLHNKWKNLDKRKTDETQEKFIQRKRAFLKYDRVAHDVMDLLTEHGNVFYLTHKYCKRGRTYSQGYHVNYQGNPWNKAVIEFADKEVVDG
ncbi:hypothetical protein [Roseococcus sp.]|uniref:hypothetical protein n=1 Tax=Roseococcus sp. TaxID=2109646 RepID=UPI003BAA3A63